MKKAIAFWVLLLTLCSLPACAAENSGQEPTTGESIAEETVIDVQYYREAESLPTVDSVTDLELFHSAYDSVNGTITQMRYYYRSAAEAGNAPERIAQYLFYLRETGFTLEEDGINVDISLDGTPLASIRITGTTMELGIDLVQTSQKGTRATEPTVISVGDTITLDFVEMTIDGIYRGDEIKEDDGPNTYHQRTSNSNNQIFWLETTMKNIGTTKFSLWGINKYIAEITFDDTYTYEAKINKLVGMGNSELTPFESAKVYIWAEIPIEMLDNYENAVIRFAFNDGFERAETEAFESMKHCFELNA